MCSLTDGLIVSDADDTAVREYMEGNSKWNE